MKAIRAYIASVGTAGVLIASSIALLVVVSALFAFRGWPDGDTARGVDGLAIDRGPSVKGGGPARLAALAAPAAASVAGAPPARAARAARAGGPKRSGVVAGAGAGSAAGTPAAGAGAGGGAQGATVAAPGGTARGSGGTGSTGTPSVPAPSDVQRTVGGTTKGLTDTAGGVVGRVSPQLGQTVTQTGKTVQGVVGGLGTPPTPPLP